MVIVYRKGEIRNQLVAWGADRERRLEGVSVVLTPLPLFTYLRRTRGDSHVVWGY